MNDNCPQTEPPWFPGPSPDHPESKCDDCGRPNVTWFAPSPVWNKVIRNADRCDPMLCPTCFIRRAHSAGVGVIWCVSPKSIPPCQPSSLIERLEYVAALDQCGAVGPHAQLCLEAASELRALKARVAELEDQMTSLKPLLTVKPGYRLDADMSSMKDVSVVSVNGVTLRGTEQMLGYLIGMTNEILLRCRQLAAEKGKA